MIDLASVRKALDAPFDPESELFLDDRLVVALRKNRGFTVWYDGAIEFFGGELEPDDFGVATAAMDAVTTQLEAAQS